MADALTTLDGRELAASLALRLGWAPDANTPVTWATDLSAFVAGVVPAMRAKGFTFELRERDVLDGTTWEAVFSNPATRVCKYDRANPARAACLAALRALESRT